MVGVWAALGVLLVGIDLGILCLLIEQMLPTDYLQDIKDYFNE